ncbi:MAG: lipoprotein [Phycisphaerales bacterium]|jgi:hypothetical protein
MRKITIYILLSLLVLAGCQEQEIQQAQVEESIEQVESQKQEPVAEATEVKPESEQVAQFEITMKIVTVDKDEYAAIDEIWGRVTKGILVSIRPEILDEAELIIGMGWRDFAGRLDGITKKLSSVEEKEISVRVSESKSAYFAIGERVFIDKFFYYGRWYDASKYKLADAVRSLKIVPRDIPGRDLINLRITPVMKGLLSDGSDMEFVQTEVGLTLKPLQPGVIGAPVQWSDYLATALLRSKENGKDRQSLLVIKVRKL